MNFNNIFLGNWFRDGLFKSYLFKLNELRFFFCWFFRPWCRIRAALCWFLFLYFYFILLFDGFIFWNLCKKIFVIAFLWLIFFCFAFQTSLLLLLAWNSWSFDWIFSCFFFKQLYFSIIVSWIYSIRFPTNKLIIFFPNLSFNWSFKRRVNLTAFMISYNFSRWVMGCLFRLRFVLDTVIVVVIWKKWIFGIIRVHI